MAETPHNSDKFLAELTTIVRENMGNEKFGVSELAEKVHMSRSNLLRKVQKASGLTASVFIRNIRLAEAQQLLWKKELTVSEVAYQVGFNSVSYFVKCYRELYGYPPGEESPPEKQEELTEKEIRAIKRPAWKWPIAAIMVLAIITVAFQYSSSERPDNEEKSILVLPFKNDSPDSSNVYLVNGLMEAILNNLQEIEDLRVLSRTTSEHYRNSSKSITEIAEELGVVYFIEGSGQKQNDQLLLTVQLIKGNTDDHVWSERYLRQTSDIFALQAEVAKDIALRVKANIAPEEIDRIDRVLTNSIVAYDYYLKGIELINQETFEGIEKGIVEFKSAIREDQDFSEAYAFIAIGYYYDDSFKGLKKYTEDIDWYANRAFELDSRSSLSLTAKGLNSMHKSNYDSAIYYFEKVLEVNPNSAQAYNMLAEIHINHVNNPRKYLQYALRSLQIDLGVQDSSTLSYTYLHLSNALVQTGFLTLSEGFIQKSMSLDPNNLFSIYVHAYIKFAQDKNFTRLEQRIMSAYRKDTNRIDIVQELAKINYNEGRYDRAAFFYDKMYEIKNIFGLNLFESEDIKAAYSYRKVGRVDDAQKAFNAYENFAERDTSLYRYLSQAAIDAYNGDIERGAENLNQFSAAKNIPFWFIMFFEDDPLLMELSTHPDYTSIMKKITDNFWAEHEEIKQELTEANVIIPK